jgi:hypothetical protein
VNEELKTKLNESALSILESLEKGVAIASTETQLFVAEYLNWIFWDNLITVFIFLLILAFSVTIGLFGLKKYNKTQDCDSCMNYFMVSGVALALFLMLSPIPFTAIKKCVQVKIAPRVVLVKEIRQLIK